jgi:polar amino acid transport system substrate-binding protein
MTYINWLVLRMVKMAETRRCFRISDFRLGFVVSTVLCVALLNLDICFADNTSPPEPGVLCCDGTTIIGHIDFPPLIYLGDAGESIGPIAEITRLVLERSKFYSKYKLVTLPTKRVVTYLTSGQIPFSPLIKGIPALQDKVIYLDWKVATVRVNAYYIGKAAPIRDLGDLRGKTIIGLRGYSYGPRIKKFIADPANRIEYYLCNTHESGFRMLERGRGDYFLDFRSPSDVVLKNLTIDELHRTELEVINVHFNISKQATDYMKLKESLDKAYQELLDEGKLDGMISGSSRVME